VGKRRAAKTDTRTAQTQNNSTAPLGHGERDPTNGAGQPKLSESVLAYWPIAMTRVLSI
jgi:hypothetical protein